MIADRAQTASHSGLRCHDLGSTRIAVSPKTERVTAHECPGNGAVTWCKQLPLPRRLFRRYSCPATGRP